MPQPTLKPIRDQVVVVMGASSGIGRATAARFAGEGAKVVVAARGEVGLRSLVDQIRADGGDAVAEVADVTDPAQMQRVAQRAVTEYGRLDTWVHAAAVLLVAPFEETTPEEFQRIIDVNLMGQVHGAMAALPHLTRQGGALIHISSMGAKRGVPLQTAYCASKHGIDGFVETLRMEVQRAELPISVTNVMPATINTPLFDQARTKIGVKPVAPPPIYQPEVVVDAIRYAAEHPVRDLVVGGSAKALILGEKLAPRLVDALLVRFGFEAHDTGEPKSADAPDNLFAPLDAHDTARDGFDASAWPTSLYTSLQRQPLLKRVPLATEALAVAGFVLKPLLR
ncbi:SDR family oxidoreductase [Modestobacter excelsi]|uniref:SDR family oxidoreductase n=1 Tax=Modestobacter excelsi TaxID=2213161 RepID=UPI00110CBB24|nr:SDR family oxidoreductase [Modestobacter excelsi]